MMKQTKVKVRTLSPVGVLPILALFFTHAFSGCASFERTQASGYRYTASPYETTVADEQVQLYKRVSNTPDLTRHPAFVQKLIDDNDIATGMTKKAVQDSWGPADDILVSGNPIYGNEKWIYKGQIGSSEGYVTEIRTVLFENGRVVGWNTK